MVRFFTVNTFLRLTVKILSFRPVAMADMALLKAIVSLYRAGEEKPMETYNTSVKVAEEIHTSY